MKICRERGEKTLILFYFPDVLFLRAIGMDELYSRRRFYNPRKPICLVSKTDRNKQILFSEAQSDPGGSDDEQRHRN